MNYTSFIYFVAVAVLLVIYYVVPGKVRWCVLLAGSICFYTCTIKNPFQILLFAGAIVISWLAGCLLEKKRSRLLLLTGIVLSSLPLLFSRAGDLTRCFGVHNIKTDWMLPVGVSFFTLQIIAYLTDIYKGKITPQKNFWKYVLFISFFPQIIQGPIPRYGQLAGQLYEPHKFDEKNIVKGFQLIVWGFFLKFMIADKAGVVVDTVFSNASGYKGMYVLVAAVLYSIELYADFQSCVILSRGVSGCFGIELVNNFDHPYFSTSIKEFWRRWHISLSSWLRDYVYIPLGGNRHGKAMKFVNLTVTFAVSGLWHGGNFKFLFWGLLHAFYQIVGELTYKLRDRLYRAARIEKGSYLQHIIKSVVTFGLVMLGWIIFRADTLKTGLSMIKSLFAVHNFWVLFDDSLFTLGLDWKEWGILLTSIIVLFIVSFSQTKVSVKDWILGQHIIVRWFIYITAVTVIVVFGTYGFGYDARDFIYGGF